MMRRTRLMAGMLSLSALTFSLAEAFAASTCRLPMPGMSIDAFGDGTRASVMDCMPAPQAKHPDRGGDGPLHCPFGPMTAAQGCVAAASLPAPAAFVDESPSAALAAITFDDAEHDILLATTPFHPPKS